MYYSWLRPHPPGNGILGFHQAEEHGHLWRRHQKVETEKKRQRNGEGS